MSLRDLTHEAHKNAERQEFVKILFSGSIDPKLYATFLKNQHPQYEILEVCAMMHGLLSDMPEIRRAPAILTDFIELWGSDSKEMPKMCPTVQKYMDYIMSIKDQPERLMAHIYVRHMGDLAGGQMIAAKVPGKGEMYKFNNPDDLKATVRTKINDNMADEAKVCFEFATEMFKEMLEIANDFK